MIIFCVSPARSASVALLRYFEARGDFDILHEPLVPLYAQTFYPEFCKDNWSDFQFHSVEELIAHIESYATSGKNLFIKEMSWAAEHFIKSPVRDTKFIILVREPEQCILSFYNKVQNLELVIQFGVNLYKKLYEFYVRTPITVLIKTEDLVAEPDKVIESMCNSLSLQFDGAMLSWDKKPSDFKFSVWNENKKASMVWHWHGDALNSTAINKATLHSYTEVIALKPIIDECLVYFRKLQI